MAGGRESEGSGEVVRTVRGVGEKERGQGVRRGGGRLRKEG